jgi:hypothetical protein
VEYTRAVPAALNLVTKASSKEFWLVGQFPPVPLCEVVWYAPVVTGKFAEQVIPVTYADPLESTATEYAASGKLPPR